MTIARYDGLADWYDEHLGAFAARGTAVLRDLLANGGGSCLEVGCGGGWQLAALTAAGWMATGVDISADQLKFARKRLGPKVALVLGDACRLPFPAQAFDVVVSAFTHTDLDDWRSAVTECARVLRPGGRFVYVGTHPCFVGPFSRYADWAAPVLYSGYRNNAWTTEGPGMGDGLRRRVGVVHLPLAELLNAVIDAGLCLEHLDEPGPEDFPKTLVVVGRR
jgi:ubiquinone/menaquinone biosynthesis C-methylase UbiE